MIETPEKHWLRWKEVDDTDDDNPLLRELHQFCGKERMLEILHDFIVFDAGTKKICRHNQYFGVKAAQARVETARGRHHLAHPGQRKEPDHGLAGEMDS